MGLQHIITRGGVYTICTDDIIGFGACPIFKTQFNMRIVLLNRFEFFIKLTLVLWNIP